MDGVLAQFWLRACSASQFGPKSLPKKHHGNAPARKPFDFANVSVKSMKSFGLLNKVDARSKKSGVEFSSILGKVFVSLVQ